MTRVKAGLLGLALLAAGCNAAESPAFVSSLSNVPSVLETFAGTLPVGGSLFYSFTVRPAGGVTVTLLSLKENGEDSAALIGMGVGKPSGVDCFVLLSQGMGVSARPNINDSLDKSVHCVRISDVGNLTAPADFVITISRPK